VPLLDIGAIDADIAASEAQVPNLRDGCEKRIIWADKPATKTSTALLYIHGFSATAEEIRPLPDLVAEGLAANIHYTRLTGHGQDGPAMGTATLEAWQCDVTEAIEIAQTIGDEIILMGCSTGCTLAALALANGANAKAVVHVSPNFGLAHRAVQFLLDLPGSKHWAKYIAGRTRAFEPISDAHSAYWTVSYPTEAVHVMADAVRAVRKAELAVITTPALFCYNEADQVVHADRTRDVIKRWGAATETVKLIQGPGDDDMGHVMAGDIFSPAQTAPLARQVLAWLHGLPAR
jgi:esterase/lipase